MIAYWLPEVLHLTGMTPSQAVFASSIIPLGGMSAVLYLGLLIDRFGPERALALHYAAGIVFIALIALVALPYFALLAVIFFAGTTIIGSQTGANGACGALYPVRSAPPGSAGRSALVAWAASPRRYWAAICWRAACRRHRFFSGVLLCIGGGDGPARTAGETRYAARAAVRTCALAVA